MKCPLCNRAPLAGSEFAIHIDFNHCNGAHHGMYRCVCEESFLSADELWAHLASFGDDLEQHLILGVLAQQ